MRTAPLMNISAVAQATQQPELFAVISKITETKNSFFLLKQMEVAIWSDIACPWCYLGKRRFEKAVLESGLAEEIKISWRSFQLDPYRKDDPENPGDMIELLAKKYHTSRQQIEAMNKNLEATAAQEGLNFNLNHIKPANTFLAHQLVHLAKEQGLANEAKEALFDAYFCKNLFLNDEALLIDLASQIGIDRARAASVFAQQTFASHVLADRQAAEDLEITGVPFFVFDNQYGVSGAQTTEVFLKVLSQVKQNQISGATK